MLEGWTLSIFSSLLSTIPFIFLFEEINDSIEKKDKKQPHQDDIEVLIPVQKKKQSDSTKTKNNPIDLSRLDSDASAASVENENESQNILGDQEKKSKSLSA